MGFSATISGVPGALKFLYTIVDKSAEGGLKIMENTILVPKIRRNTEQLPKILVDLKFLYAIRPWTAKKIEKGRVIFRKSDNNSTF